MKKPTLHRMYRSSLGLCLGLGAVILAQPARSHGAHIDYRIAPAVEVQARFDTGEPMAQAQVAVFAPGDPETPWQTGLTDEAGTFRFSPALEQAGAWEVQVRQAGHGSIITIPVDAQGLAAGQTALGLAGSAGTSSSLSPGQTGLMIGLGLWGLLGTGLFFSRSPRSRLANSARETSLAMTPTDADASREPPIPV